MEESTNTNKGNGFHLPKPNNVIPIKVTMGLDFFKWWCLFLKPFINLTPRERDVIASFLNQRWELSKKTSDPAILDAMVMSNDTKSKVITECDISQAHFYVVMSNLRKNKIIVNNVINPRLIPNIRKDDNGFFQLLVLFKDDKKTA